MRFARFAFTIAAILALAVPAGAEDLAPQITDIAGDANVVNGQGFEDITGVNPSQPNDTANYKRADLRAVRFETAYTAVPVGADGIDYQATGLKIHVTTTDVPGSDGPTLIYRINTTVSGCASFLQSYLRGATSAPVDAANNTLQWRQLDAGCPDGVKTVTNAAWTTTVDAASKTLTMTFPFSSLTPAQQVAMSVGDGYLGLPAGEVRTQLATATAPLIDATPAYEEDYIIGSDVPADVPCTLECPAP